jgi:hypothetical protein
MAITRSCDAGAEQHIETSALAELSNRALTDAPP